MTYCQTFDLNRRPRLPSLILLDFWKGAAMKMMVVIPIEAYNAILEKCDSTSPEYSVLKNGVVTRNRQGNEEVEILCDAAGAKRMMDFAATGCPEVIPFIRVNANPPR